MTLHPQSLRNYSQIKEKTKVVHRWDKSLELWSEKTGNSKKRGKASKERD